MKILIVSDAWVPQTNGVVTTMTQVISQLEKLGHTVKVLHPGLYQTIPMPGYKEIPLTWRANGFDKHIRAFQPDAIHIVTEGPLGLRARAWCLRRNRPFTTSFHTKFAEYLNKRLPFIPVGLGYALLRWFHAPAKHTLVSTQSLIDDLSQRGFEHLFKWNRGVDTALFTPQHKIEQPWPHPIHLYVGRVAVEKNLPEFLKLDLPGSKVVVGDGPDKALLEKQFPNAHFVGKLSGIPLAQQFASADVFVFPSKTDTYGLVMLEALAAGTPIAAYPTTGPIDILTPQTGVMADDLQEAIHQALTLDHSACRDYALQFSWQACAETFVAALSPFPETLEIETKPLPPNKSLIS
ncbi:glycosyltransferase family 1 protein [Thiomicrorhabdus sp. zzn3]|uniref:glycosyltransferase family 4 protein n=1 Tax=Thiomicrorhabdus sp. zzn3 TaxID=3039775 RepID=UPI002436484C|nr:glycosyltransferase family 1 protein [Thiomicrorhabdus sp. zzn3]MDG6777090.1 glycosyltransferase family 1 protein [Thiomicrorhabdus sp. zzn3]